MATLSMPKNQISNLYKSCVIVAMKLLEEHRLLGVLFLWRPVLVFRLQGGAITQGPSVADEERNMKAENQRKN